MNAHCHTRCRKCHMLEEKYKYKLSLPAPSPSHPPPCLKWTSPKHECWLQDTGPFHFCLDKSVLVYDFPHSTFILDLTASIWHYEAYSHFFSSCPVPTESSVSLSASNEETLETAEKTIKPTAIKQQKRKEYDNTWMTDFAWHRHEHNSDTEKSDVSAWPSFCRPCCARVETGVGKTKLFLKEEEVWLLLWQEGGRGRGAVETCTLLGLGNVDCTGLMRVSTGILFYCQDCIVSTA